MSLSPIRNAALALPVFMLLLGGGGIGAGDARAESSVETDDADRGAETASSDRNEYVTSWPAMDAQRGRLLFAQRGCVVCHAVNNVGGNIGPAFDARDINLSRDPFDFFARMWHGAREMLHLQRADLGYQSAFNGQELADIYAFIHDESAQEDFTEDDLPDQIRQIIDNGPAAENDNQ